ncbi:DUF3231 family protein [Ammoniphilus sp. YIM 78166]|uniref:DUF3231 family protein n=1 Tax=Ammoniphilus sp. YIM 78166 TaxID=1644106 RepID=UPI001F100814|nr:DUF3231 family protein [Ammoniphilus sp. YIM 78166]
MQQMTQHNISLTSTEIASLWTNYMQDSMAQWILSYFLKHVEDSEIQSVLDYALRLSKKHLKGISDILQHENFPLPQGFTEKDVNLEAPRLFSDTFYLVYLHNMGRIGLTAYSVALPTVARSDVRDHFTECLASSSELYNKTAKVMLDKGLYPRSPYIPVPEQIDFVKKQGFLTGWFGDRRPLSVVEISHIFVNIQTNAVGRALFTAFSQTAQSTPIRKHMERGGQLASKYIEVLGSLLSEENLPSPMTWDDQVLNSTTPPFSDKLMMFHTSIMCTSEIGNYGAAIGGSLRRDLISHYTRFLGEIGLFAEDTVNILIEHEWLEQIPLAADRHKLALK